LETLEAETPTALIPKLRDMLGAFLFRGDDVYKAVSVLSGGEKSRLALLRLLLHPVNLLILDEPTNHLDLHSKDVLLDALTSYSGTVIFVSHDRAFMEALSTKTLELSRGEARLHYGNYAYYLQRQEGSGTQTVGSSGEVSPSGSPISGAVGPSSSAAEYRETEKKRQGAVRRLEKEEEGILKRMERLETEKKLLEREIQRPEIYSDGLRVKDVQSRLDSITAELEAASQEWERIAEKLEDLRQGAPVL
jgi:ATP-binding cassette subfamily F protein 3